MSLEKIRLIGKHICALFLFSIAAIMISTPAYAETTEDGIKYVLDGGSITITGYSGNRDYLNIPDSIDGHEVTAIKDLAFAQNKTIKKVRIPLSINQIGVNPFFGCKNLVVIFTPPENKLFSTLDGCLYQIDTKELISVPDHFYSLHVPDGIQIIGERAFAGNTVLEVVIPSSVTKIGKEAFSGCKNLSDINTLHCNELGAEAFKNCQALKLIEFSEGLKEIPVGAFGNCSSLKRVTLPESLTVIADYAFGDCEKLSDIKLGNVEIIGDNAFSKCSSLSRLELPESLRQIGLCAFLKCNSLREISIPESVSVIPSMAFSNCESLSTVNLPSQLKEIGTSAFVSCDALNFIDIPPSVNKIGVSAFATDYYSFMTVEPGSYAEEYAVKNTLSYFYPDSYDWLNAS